MSEPVLHPDDDRLPLSLTKPAFSGTAGEITRLRVTLLEVLRTFTEEPRIEQLQSRRSQWVPNSRLERWDRIARGTDWKDGDRDEEPANQT